MKPEDSANTIRIVTVVGMLLNILLASLKFAAGILCSCQALIADAVHSTSDLITDIAVIAGVKYWSRPPDKDHPYGHARIETMVTALIGFMLGLVGIGLGYDAVQILLRGDAPESKARGATFCIALGAVVVKELLYQWTVRKGRETGSSALEANAWHHRSDAVSSIPVALAILITMIFPTLWYVDQIGAFIVSLFILYAAWDILKPALNELIDSGMSVEFYEEIQREAMSVHGILAVHAVRARRLGNELLLDMHILVDGGKTVMEGHKIAHQVHDRLTALPHLNIADVIVHVEPYLPDELVKDGDFRN